MQKVRQFFLLHELKIFLCVAFVAIGGISYAWGHVSASQSQQPLIIEKPTIGESSVVSTPTQKEEDASKNTDENDAETCLYIGSQQGSKYYPPTCSFAKKIKPGNLRCFHSQDDAHSKGYERSTAC